METIGFALAVAQTSAQFTGVVKRHAEAYAKLHTLAASIENKAKNCHRAANRIRHLMDNGIQADLFEDTEDSLKEVRTELDAICCQIETSSRTGNILQAPVLVKSLEEICSNLSDITQFFNIVGVLGSMISNQRLDARDIIGTAFASLLSSTGNIEAAQRFLQDIQTKFSSLNDSSIVVREGDFYLQTGISETSSSRYESAARYFNKAIKLGKKEAFRHYGDLYYKEDWANHHCFRTAVGIYRKGADANDPGSKFKLGWCYEWAQGVLFEPEESVKYFQEAANDGCGEAIAELGYLKLHAKMMPSDYSGAYRLLKRAENMNILLAKEPLAWCYEKGIQTDQDLTRAFQLYRESFDGGNLLTVKQLVHCYDTGKGVEKDPFEATKLLEDCMSRGQWYKDQYKALYGLRLILGNGIRQNIAQGRAHIIDSCKSSSLSRYIHGECHRHGIGFSKDIRQAEANYMKAINCEVKIEGAVESEVALGEIYESGACGIVNNYIAYDYYLSAAKQLNSVAQWKVANAFESGVVLEKDVHRAVYYLILCANAGNIEAQRKTAMYYMKGHGIERPRAYVLGMIRGAAQAGDKEARRWLRRKQYRSFREFLNIFRRPCSS